EGLTPLHFAGLYNREGVSKMLLVAGADAAASCARGQTPLHYVAQSEKYGTGVAENLLNAGADVDPKDSSGKTPIYWAARQGNLSVSRKLLESGA
ncbi:ankyrin repeat protein, partial [Baffinella frigidus]